MVTYINRNKIVSYLRGKQPHQEMTVSFKRLTRQQDEKAIPIKDFRQMMRERIIPDKEEFAEINTIDNRRNVLRKSKDDAMAADMNSDISPNRY